MCDQYTLEVYKENSKGTHFLTLKPQSRLKQSIKPNKDVLPSKDFLNIRTFKS